MTYYDKLFILGVVTLYGAIYGDTHWLVDWHISDWWSRLLGHFIGMLLIVTGIVGERK